MNRQHAEVFQSELYRPLTGEQVKKIADEALRVLEKGGMLVHTRTGREALRKAGARVDDSSGLVRFPRSLVEDAVASNPSSITLHARKPGYDVVLEKNRVHYGTGGTAIYVLDPDSGERRPSTIEDVILNARMVEQLQNIHLFTINVFPNEIQSRDHIDINRFFHSLDNTGKHVMGGLYSLQGCRQTVEMAEELAGGARELAGRPFVSFITLIISPFKIDDRYGEMTCYLAGKGLPVVVPTEPICGTTSPVTLAGNVLTHIAETLGGIALVQSVRKGAPGICGSVGSITNLQNMDHVGGAIERAMINAAVSQLAQYFEIPLYSTGGTSDAVELDIQAAWESAMSSLLVAMSGANYIHDIAGLMEADLTVSYDKLVMDNEILGMCQRVLRGIEVNDDTLAADLMIERGPGAHYLDADHTIEHMRNEFYSPLISSREKREVPGRIPAAAAARNFVEMVRRQESGSLLEPRLRQRILTRFPEIVKPTS
ncbi:MAG: trimethylamine methyltransferase [Spirochaetaceae bacterium]|nr:MAG: trimethylamine methyltransferase [Spirochaetaceae bacterium]